LLLQGGEKKREDGFAWVVGEASWLCLRCCNRQIRARDLYNFSQGKKLRTWEEIVEIACVALRAEGRLQKAKFGNGGIEGLSKRGEMSCDESPGNHSQI
jgi:hypothetical protein